MRPKQYKPFLPTPGLSVRHQRLGTEFALCLTLFFIEHETKLLCQVYTHS